MEMLVLPPEDQLVPRHYWHTSAYRMKGFLPPMLTTPPSRRRLPSKNTLFNLSDGYIDSNKRSFERKNPVLEDASPTDRSQSLLPLPRHDSFLRNRPPAPVFQSSFPPVAPSVIRSVGNLSLPPQSHHNDFSVLGTENETGKPTQRLKAVSERAPFARRHRDDFRTARSLPEKAVLMLSNAQVDKKSFKEKKPSNEKAAESVYQREAPEITPLKVKILQRADTREAEIRNLARFKGVPVSELCEERGNMRVATAENFSSKDSSFDKASSRYGEQNLSENPDLVVQSSPEGSLTTELFDFSTGDSSKSLWASELLSEKWAGPCYTVSPPPSSLPFPKFGLQRQGLSPQRIGNSHTFPKSKHIQMDTEMATKDLRRILRLDFA